jgi:hypothetical protein
MRIDLEHEPSVLIILLYRLGGARVFFFFAEMKTNTEQG